MKLRITAEDIKKAKRQSACACPIARALRRRFKKTWREVDVGSYTALVGKQRYNLSYHATLFISTFDRGFAVKPQTIEIEKAVRIQHAPSR